MFLGHLSGHASCPDGDTRIKHQPAADAKMIPTALETRCPLWVKSGLQGGDQRFAVVGLQQPKPGSEIKGGSVGKKKAACFSGGLSNSSRGSRLVVHVTHAARAMRHCRSFRLWLFSHHGLGGDEESGNGGGAL